MKTIAIILTTLAAIFTASAETVSVTATLNGKQIEIGPSARREIVQRCVDLLASCAYRDAKPNWGASPTAPPNIADAQKQSHLRLLFSDARKVQAPLENVTLRVREMVITLPLTAGGIWVRTDDGVSYFAMFDYSAATSLQTLLNSVQSHGKGA